MRNILYITFTLCLLGAFTSCQDDYVPEKTATSALAGEWFVRLLAEGEDGELEDIYHIDYFNVLTSNTAANDPDSIWIDDHEDVLPLKLKVGANVSNLTFAGTGEERYEGGTVVITNGKILKGMAITTGGNVTDSIHFNAEFPWDPGVIYTVAGYRRTGFQEDEH